MGEIAEMMEDGTLCEVCGIVMEDLIPKEGNTLIIPPGYPRSCPACEEEADEPAETE